MFNNEFRHKTVTNTILRYEAEALLEGRPEGSFLLRDSAQDEYLFSVSFRRYPSISSLRHMYHFFREWGGASLRLVAVGGAGCNTT